MSVPSPRSLGRLSAVWHVAPRGVPQQLPPGRNRDKLAHPSIKNFRRLVPRLALQLEPETRKTLRLVNKKPPPSPGGTACGQLRSNFDCKPPHFLAND
jgi:hypothetical protein